jgi:sRNA-binding protein
VADEGATVEAGGVVAKYLGAKKEEAKLLEGQQRGEYYAKVLAEAEKSNDEDKIGLAKGKVEEKKRMVDEATAALEKLVVKAPAAGKVSKASRPRAVKAGDVVVETTADGAKTLRATFDAGASASKFHAGQEVRLSSKDKAISAVVDGVADGKVTVRVASGVAAGDEVKLAPPK